MSVDPGRRKYACRECGRRPRSTVCPAAASAWPMTWPPKTRGRVERDGLPMKRPSPADWTSRRSSSSSTVAVMCRRCRFRPFSRRKSRLFSSPSFSTRS